MKLISDFDIWLQCNETFLRVIFIGFSIFHFIHSEESAWIANKAMQNLSQYFVDCCIIFVSAEMNRAGIIECIAKRPMLSCYRFSNEFSVTSSRLHNRPAYSYFGNDCWNIYLHRFWFRSLWLFVFWTLKWDAHFDLNWTNRNRKREKWKLVSMPSLLFRSFLRNWLAYITQHDNMQFSRKQPVVTLSDATLGKGCCTSYQRFGFQNF